MTGRTDVTADVLEPSAFLLSHDDRSLVEDLRRRDEGAFVTLVNRYGPSMVRVARGHVPSQAVAEEVAQETWLAVLQGIDRFEGRSSLRTWIFGILVKQAIKRGTRERRTVPFSSLVDAETGGDDAAVDPSRFFGPGAQWPMHWATPPRHWGDVGADRLIAGETRALIDQAIEGLPPAQRTVVTLRDIAGVDASDVCAMLDISEANQRVLLHRGRSKVRKAIAAYFEEP